MTDQKRYPFSEPISHSTALELLENILLKLPGSKATVFVRTVEEWLTPGSETDRSLSIRRYPDCSLSGRIYLPCGEEAGFGFEPSNRWEVPYRGLYLNSLPGCENPEEINKVVSELVKKL